MAFTQEQLDALDAAISSGSKRVKYADKEVEYQSIADMLRIRDLMAQELGLVTVASKRKLASFNKGVYPADENGNGCIR